jgi:hypothetical protein
MISEGWETVKTAAEWYFSNGYIWVCLCFSLIFIILSRPKKKYSVFIAWYIILIGIICLNPIVAYILTRMGLDGVYWRIFWIMPIGCIIACAFVKGTYHISKRAIRVEVSCICILVLILSGKFVYTSENFQKATNIYKIPDDVIEVSDYLEDNSKIIAPDDILIWIRTYNPTIELLYGRQALFFGGRPEQEEVKSLLECEIWNAEEIANLAQTCECQYIVVAKVQQVEGDWENFGYFLDRETENYLIYLRQQA